MIKILLFISFVIAGGTELARAHISQHRDRDRQEAERVWEQAVAAKGGRDRLYAVRNLLATESWGRHYGGNSLYVFPNKVWDWSNEPEPFGRSAEMYNLERNLAYLTYADDPESPRRLGSDALGSARANIIKAQLYYLLETPWVKPVPIGVTSGGRVGRRTVDIVQTLVDGKRVDFYLDRESHLPLKVAFINERDGRPYYWIMFSDYALVNGIQMPQLTNGMGDADVPTSIQLDVGYDESIFERPPSIEAGAEAWRARR